MPILKENPPQVTAVKQCFEAEKRIQTAFKLICCEHIGFS